MKNFFIVLCICSTQAAWSQNIGIGTTAPSMKLHISNASDTTLLLLENRTALNAGTNAGLYFKNGDWFTSAIKTTGTSSNTARLGLFSYADENFSGLIERLSITDNGNVGINNIVPQYKLDVAGTLRASQSSNDDYTATILNPVSRGKGALRVAMGNSTGLSIGNATLVVENDTLSGSAIRAVSKYVAISAESNTASKPSLLITNSASSFPLAALFYGNVEVNATSLLPAASGNLTVAGNLTLTKGGGAGKILTSDAVGKASWKTGTFAAKAVLASNYSLPNIGDYALPFKATNAGGFDDIGSYNSNLNQFEVSETGTYFINASVEFRLTSFTGIKYFSVTVKKNNSRILLSEVNMEYNSQQGADRTVTVGGVVKLNAGDYVYVLASQQTGITQEILYFDYVSFFNVTRLY